MRGRNDMMWSLTSHPQSVRQTLAQICTYLRECDLDEGQCLNVELVLAEALNNICEHAYAGADDGRILTAISCRGADVQCHITDKGRAMPNLTPPLGGFRDPDNFAFDELPVGGFGWGLIRAIAQDVQYERRDLENHLFLTIAAELEQSPQLACGLV